MFEIGDKVFYVGYMFKTENLEIIEIVDDMLVKVKGTFFYQGKDNEVIKTIDTRVFRKYELTDKDPTNGVKIHEKDKWRDILIVTPNMGGVVKEMYEDVKKGKININPFYQRDLVWTLEQKQKYIFALFKEKARIDITTIVDIHSKSDCYIELLDGKQRLTTIFDFIENKFQLDNGCYFKDLHIDDMKFLLNLNFHYKRIEPTFKLKQLTDVQKVELFLEVNELGTKMDQKHIDKVKEKYLK